MENRVVLNIDSWTRHFTGREATDWMLPLFWTLARKYPKAEVGEIGLRGGTSTVAFLLGVLESGGHVTSVDLDPCEEALDMFREFKLDHLHTFIQGDSHEASFPRPLDILYIDGCHSYDGVKADYDRHINSLKDGGIILLHDTISWPDVGAFCLLNKIPTIALGAGLGVIMPNGPMPLDGSRRSPKNAHQPE